MTPLVSVIICFLNEEIFLSEAIESVLQQTYSNVEIILVDDGSTDSSVVLAKSFLKKYSDQITLIQHENGVNKGLSASRNLGIKHSKGQLIAFLDADDIYLPGYIQNQVDKLLKFNADYICEATLYWESWTKNKYEDRVIKVGALNEKVYRPQELNQILYPLKMNAAPCMCAVMAKKEAILRNRGFNEDFPGMYEDQVFLSKMYFNEVGYISSSCNNWYRQRHDSMMSTVAERGKYLEIRYKFLLWFREYLKGQKIKNRKINNLLRKAITAIQYPRLSFLFNKLQSKLGIMGN